LLDSLLQERLGLEMGLIAGGLINKQEGRSAHQ